MISLLVTVCCNFMFEKYFEIPQDGKATPCLYCVFLSSKDVSISLIESCFRRKGSNNFLAMLGLNAITIDVIAAMAIIFSVIHNINANQKQFEFLCPWFL
jgi:hypothetical protein